MKSEIDTSRGIHYGILTKDGRFAAGINSICWNCKKPVGKCDWLMKRRMYDGTVYWTEKVHWDNYEREIYIITKCPWEDK